MYFDTTGCIAISRVLFKKCGTPDDQSIPMSEVEKWTLEVSEGRAAAAKPLHTSLAFFLSRTLSK